MKSANNVNDIIFATTNWKTDDGLKHERKDNFVEFVRGEVLIKAEENKYEAITIVGITDQDEKVFYDIVDMYPSDFKIKKKESSTTAASTNAVSDIQEDSFEKSIAQTKTKSQEGNFQNMFKGQNNAGINAREYLIQKGYDGVNNGGEEYIAFYPEQIKLISNAEPTKNKDIRYSLSAVNEDLETKANVQIDEETKKDFSECIETDLFLIRGYVFVKKRFRAYLHFGARECLHNNKNPEIVRVITEKKDKKILYPCKSSVKLIASGEKQWYNKSYFS